MMIAHHVRRWTVACLALTALACKSSNEPKGGDQPAELSQLPRNLTSAETKVVSSANAFTFALFRETAAAEPNANVFLSPLSASLSLGMTLNGARTTTFDAMRTALQFGQASQADINAGYRGLIDMLSDLDPSVKFTIANSIWYRNTLPVASAFLDAARTSFDAKAEGLDFANQTASLATINGWVNEKTGGKIPTVLDEIRDEHVMFLANAIYFKGSWRDKFDKANTRAGTFTPATGAAQTVQLMTRTGEIANGEVNGARVIDLPYGNSAFSLTAVLPPTGTTVDAYAASLTQTQWDALVASLHERSVPIVFPKLRMEYERQLKPDLTALGMGIAFTDFADLSGLTSTGQALSIGFVKQKTFVEIDEEGTEAAAVTVTGVVVTSAPTPIEFNRPFVFAIRERLTGTILFIGKINRIP
jgi:serine protease inhibitor